MSIIIPKLAIITVHNGNISELERTLISIDQQTQLPRLHLVVSKKKINSFFYKRHYRKIISEKDKSIYHAMNLGLEKTNKYHVLFLNSGDYFFSKDSVKIINHYITLYPYNCLNFLCLLKNKKIFYKIKKKYFYQKNFKSHPSFVSKNLNKNYYDEKYRIISDGIWMKKQSSAYGVKKIYRIISIHALGGISSAPSLFSVFEYILKSFRSSYKEIIKFFLFFFMSKNKYYDLIFYKKYIKLLK